MRLSGFLGSAALALALLVPGTASGQAAATPATPATLFAVLFRTGPKWDAARPQQEQAFFQEHSANLKRLRQAGAVALGARYADVGLIVVRAADADSAKRLFQEDPSVAGGTFQIEVHPFSAFYKGCVD